MNGKEILDYYNEHGEIVVNFKTKEGYVDFLKYVNDKGLKWLSGDKPDAEHKYPFWDRHGNMFCLRIESTYLRRGNLKAYREWDYPLYIVEYESKISNINNW